MNKSDAPDVRIVEIASSEKTTGVKRDRDWFFSFQVANFSMGKQPQNPVIIGF